MFDSFKKRLWFLKIKLQDVGVMPKLTSKVMTYYKFIQFEHFRWITYQKLKILLEVKQIWLGSNEEFVKILKCHLKWVKTLNGFCNQNTNPNIYMHEWTLIFYYLKQKTMSIHIVEYIHVHTYVVMLRTMMKWPRTRNKIRCKIKGFD
jgi:hypothetical protein